MKHLVVRSAWILGMTLAAFSGCDNTREQTETRQGAATTGLQPGDVAITCFDSLDTSGTAGTSGGLGKQMIQIFTLVPLPGARDIRWTDREATTDGTFNTGEIVDVDTGILNAPAGSGWDIIGAPLDLDDPNESVFIYEGTVPAGGGTVSGGSLLWGISVTTAGSWAAGPGPTGENSALPTVLANANVALDEDTPSKAQHFAYTGPTSGTKAALQAAIANPANWTRGGTTCLTTGLTVTDAPDGGFVGAGGAGGATGTAGAGGTAGTTGTAGTAGTTGTAGTVGAAGTTGAAGTGVSGGAGTTGAGGRGGTTGAAGSGGRGGTSAGGRGGGTAGSSGGGDSGCGCATSGTSNALSGSISLLVVGMLITSHRRRRRS